jgi:hypothetical protein
VTPPLRDGILLNELGPLPSSSSRTTKKLMNFAPDTPLLFPPASVDRTEDKNLYLNEMRASLKKPMANVQPIGR